VELPLLLGKCRKELGRLIRDSVWRRGLVLCLRHFYLEGSGVKRVNFTWDMYSMAAIATGLVAFDLDNTLGCFDGIYPWGYFFSVDELENGVNALDIDTPPALKGRLKKAEQLFIKKLRAYRELFSVILRPNLDALIKPLIRAKRNGTVRAICMYSNTSSTFTMHFAKHIIEEQYSCPGFFDCMVDATDPIRKHDWEDSKDWSQPLKTFPVLKRIFKEYCGVTDIITPDRILFVDDRKERHHLANEEKHGLTYLQVTPYVPDITRRMREMIYTIGLEVLLETNLVDYPPYLFSNIFETTREKRTDSGRRSRVDIRGMFDMLEFTETAVLSPWSNPVDFSDDTAAIRRVMALFVKRCGDVKGVKK